MSGTEIAYRGAEGGSGTAKRRVERLFAASDSPYPAPNTTVVTSRMLLLHGIVVLTERIWSGAT
eukprot:1301517-Rhodomonas_salina.1